MQAEDISLPVRQWVEPSPPPMGYDGNLASAPIFDGATCAFLEVYLKTRLFQDNPAGHPVPDPFDFLSFHISTSFRPKHFKGADPVAAKADGCRARMINGRRDKGATRRSFPCRRQAASGTVRSACVRDGSPKRGKTDNGLPLCRQPCPKGGAHDLWGFLRRRIRGNMFASVRRVFRVPDAVMIAMIMTTKAEGATS